MTVEKLQRVNNPSDVLGLKIISVCIHNHQSSIILYLWTIFSLHVCVRKYEKKKPKNLFDCFVVLLFAWWKARGEKHFSRENPLSWREQRKFSRKSVKLSGPKNSAFIHFLVFGAISRGRKKFKVAVDLKQQKNNFHLFWIKVK